MSKKRTLQRAGFVHVSGWVSKDDAPQIEARIEAEKAKVAEVLKNDE